MLNLSFIGESKGGRRRGRRSKIQKQKFKIVKRNDNTKRPKKSSNSNKK